MTEWRYRILTDDMDDDVFPLDVLFDEDKSQTGWKHQAHFLELLFFFASQKKIEL